MESGFPNSTIVVGSKAMAAELDVVVDPAVGGQKALCLTGRLEPLHLPFSSSRRLVRYFGAVVEISALSVLDTWQDLALGGGVALQLVGDDDSWNVLQTTQQLAEEAPCRLGTAPALNEDVEDVVLLVDRTPEIMLLATPDFYSAGAQLLEIKLKTGISELLQCQIGA
jgi:hypothetical protein